MFGWLGDFVSDIGAGTGAALGLTTGLLAGAVVTMQLSGGTPDMQPTTSPVAAVAHAPVPQPPGDQTSPRVVRLAQTPVPNAHRQPGNGRRHDQRPTQPDRTPQVRFTDRTPANRRVRTRAGRVRNNEHGYLR